LQANLLELNYFMGADDIVKKVFSFKNKKNKWFIICEVQGTTFCKLVDRYINLSSGRFYCKEDCNVNRCFRCQDFFHTAKNCTKSFRCVSCGGAHDSKKCLSETIVCCNCKDAGFDKVDHKSNSTECPVYCAKMAMVKNKTDYHFSFAN
jgi:hypothetical protein